MSIYATGWTLRIPAESWGDGLDGWLEIYAQHVPAHIGQPSEGDRDDTYYASFLPPPVANYDPYSAERQTDRAVVIVQTGREKKDGQRYMDPVLVVSGEEYERMTVRELLARVYQNIDRALLVQKPTSLGDPG